MDSCKKFRDLILTDYMDAQLDAASQAQVDRHLQKCAACKAFAAEVKNLVLPFEKATRQQVPAHLWKAIEERIQQEQYSPQNLWDLICGWIEGISFPKLVPALGSLVMLIVVGSTVFFNYQIEQARNQEQGAYLAYMLSPLGTSAQAENNNWGTSLEQYFL